MATGRRRSRPHFGPELFRFLRQLSRNNNREWFEKNRGRYLEHVRDPMLQFIADFSPLLARISRHFNADPRPSGGSMFRVHRDTRFSKDKRPYKTMAAAQFRHKLGKDVHAPGFYLHLGVDGVFAGSGLWHPDPGALSRIRQAIVDNPRAWKSIKIPVLGESLKRPPRGFDPAHPLVEDLKRKDFYTMTELTERDACSPGFLDRYAEICTSTKPLMKFLTRAVGVPW